MLALDYNDFVSAKLKTYAILGDRGEHNFTFRVTDGLDNGVIQTVPVRVESDFISYLDHSLQCQNPIYSIPI